MALYSIIKKTINMYNREEIAEALFKDQKDKRKAPRLKGEIIGYKIIKSYIKKKDSNEVINTNYYLVKLKVLKSYKRYSIAALKWNERLQYIHTRAEKALVIDIIDESGNHVSSDTPILANSSWYWKVLTTYQVGKIVKPDRFEKWTKMRDICDHGIHMIDRTPEPNDHLISILPHIYDKPGDLINNVMKKLKSGEIKWRN